MDRFVYTDYNMINQKIIDQAKKTLKEKVFPIVGNSGSIDVDNIEIKYEPIGFQELKDLIKQKGTYAADVKADVIVKDKDGKVVKKERRTIMKLPLLTPMYYYLIDGTEFNVFNQIRLRSGIYGRIQRSGLPEVQFNLAKGQNFSLESDPETGEIYVKRKQGGKINIIDIFKAYGLSDEKIKEILGPEIFNSNITYSKESGVIKAKEFIESMKDSVLDPNTTEITVGKPLNTVNLDTFKLATKKLIDLSKNPDLEDDLNNLAFKEVKLQEDLISEAIEKRSRLLTKKFASKLNKELDIPPGFSFSSALMNFFKTSSLSYNPEHNNFLEILDSVGRVTYMGEGGIGNTNAIPEEIRDVHPSYIGAIDLIRTSESDKVGADLRFASSAYVDSEGYLNVPVVDVKTGKEKMMSVKELFKLKFSPSLEDNYYIQNGKFFKGKPDFVLASPLLMFSPVTSSVPFLNTNHGNRLQMASKMLTQAVPIVGKEKPKFTTLGFDFLSNFISIKSPVDGVVQKVSKDSIEIKTKDNQIVKIPYATYFPLARKTFLQHQVLVKPGDKVKAGDLIADSNYTQDGEIAIGTNLRVAYMPYKGLNHEDGIVVSESAAKKLASEHIYKFDIELDQDTEANKKKFMGMFPLKFEKDIYDNYDEYGLPKPGTKLKPGDPVYLLIRKSIPSAEDIILGRLSKQYKAGFRPHYEEWNKDVEGEVTDVAFDGKSARIIVRTYEPAKEGDKLTNLHGGKGVITKILPDSQMPHTEDGKPVDVILTPLGILSRINPGQIYEIMANKIAEKTNTPIEANGFTLKDAYSEIADNLKRLGISDTETVIDPLDPKKRKKKVLVGPAYILKLNKMTDFNFSARGAEGTFDIDLRPSKGGEEGSKAIGQMEQYGLISHNVKDLFKEISTYKASKNPEFWNALYLGKPLPKMKHTFATEKFFNLLRGAGINVDYDFNRNYLKLVPLTDKKIQEMSAGEIKNAYKLDFKLNPEPGGLFDPVLTGGLSGEKWTHIEVAEPFVNPIFENIVYKVLPDLKGKPLIGKEIKEQLEKIKPEDLINSQDPDLVPVGRALKENGFKNLAEAYILTKVPVLPPKLRPIIPLPNNNLMVHDTNYFYTDIIVANNALKELKEKLPDELLQKEKETVYNNIKALYGLIEPTSPYAQTRGLKGILNIISGKIPKESYFQSKVVKKLQAPAGRGTLVTDINLNIDQIGIPEDMAWKMYSPHIIRNLNKLGYPVNKAKEMIDKKDPVARNVLNNLIKEIPVIINRAPSLWKYNLVAGYPVLHNGKSVAINMLIAKGLAGDLDGDTVNVHIPITPKAIEDAKKMLPSRIGINDQNNELLYAPSQEAIIGLNYASNPVGQPVTFNTYEEMKKALEQGIIDHNTPTKILEGGK